MKRTKHGKPDGNQNRIIADLRRAGYSVQPITAVNNSCDLIVGSPDKSRTELIEVKNDTYCTNIRHMDQDQRTKFLTDGERKFHELFKVWIVINAEEIIKIFES